MKKLLFVIVIIFCFCNVNAIASDIGFDSTVPINNSVVTYPSIIYNYTQYRINLTVKTNTTANCRYSSSTSVFDVMLNFTHNTTTTFSTALDIVEGDYVYNVSCKQNLDSAEQYNFTINFTVDYSYPLVINVTPTVTTIHDIDGDGMNETITDTGIYGKGNVGNVSRDIMIISGSDAYNNLKYYNISSQKLYDTGVVIIKNNDPTFEDSKLIWRNGTSFEINYYNILNNSHHVYDTQTHYFYHVLDDILVYVNSTDGYIQYFKVVNGTNHKTNVNVSIWSRAYLYRDLIVYDNSSNGICTYNITNSENKPINFSVSLGYHSAFVGDKLIWVLGNKIKYYDFLSDKNFTITLNRTYFYYVLGRDFVSFWWSNPYLHYYDFDTGQVINSTISGSFFSGPNNGILVYSTNYRIRYVNFSKYNDPSYEPLNLPIIASQVPAMDIQINTSAQYYEATFNCSAYDQHGLKNVSLYFSNNSFGNLVLNETSSLSETRESMQWKKNLTSGNYYWNCIFFNNLGNAINATKHTHVVNSSWEQINLASTLPLNNSVVIYPSIIYNYTQYRINLTVITNTTANCRYSSSSMVFDNMLNFTHNTTSVFSTALDIVEGDYVYNVSCKQNLNSVEQYNFIINFTVDYSYPLVINVTPTVTTIHDIDGDGMNETITDTGIYGKGNVGNVSRDIMIISGTNAYNNLKYYNISSQKLYDTGVIIKKNNDPTFEDSKLIWRNGTSFEINYYNILNNSHHVYDTQTHYFYHVLDDILVYVNSTDRFVQYFRIVNGTNHKTSVNLSVWSGTLRYKDLVVYMNGSNIVYTYNITNSEIRDLNFTANIGYLSTFMGDKLVWTQNNKIKYYDFQSHKNFTYSLNNSYFTYVLGRDFVSFWWSNPYLQYYDFGTGMIINTTISGTFFSGPNNGILAYSTNYRIRYVNLTRYSNPNYAPISNPIVEYQYPENNSYTTSNVTYEIIFNCSGYDQNGLANVSLYLSNSTKGNFAFNDSTVLNNLRGSGQWSKNLSNGSYQWNCKFKDNLGNTNWGTLNTLNVSATIPSLNVSFAEMNDIYIMSKTNGSYEIQLNYTVNRDASCYVSSSLASLSLPSSCDVVSCNITDCTYACISSPSSGGGGGGGYAYDAYSGVNNSYNFTFGDSKNRVRFTCYDSNNNSATDVTNYFVAREEPITVEWSQVRRQLLVVNQTVDFISAVTNVNAILGINLSIVDPLSNVYRLNYSVNYVSAIDGSIGLKFNLTNVTGFYEFNLTYEDELGNQKVIMNNYTTFMSVEKNVSIVNSTISFNVTFEDPTTGSVLHVGGGNSTNTILPNTTVNVKIDIDDNKLNVVFPVDPEKADIVIRATNISSNITNLNFGIGNESRYVPLNSYAFEVENSSSYNCSFIVKFDYSSFNISDTSKITIFKSDYDFNASQINYSNAHYYRFNDSSYPLYINTTEEFVYINITSFSTFIMNEDQAVVEVCDNGIDDDFDGSIDENCDSNDDDNDDSTGGSSGGGGSGGAAPSSGLLRKQTWTTMTVGKKVMKISNADIPMKKLMFDVIKESRGVVVSVEVLNITPNFKRRYFSYIELNKTNLPIENVNSILGHFQVSKEWINENNLHYSDISMFRFENNDWNDLKAQYVGQDESYINFSVVLPEFSYFVIAEKESVEVTTSLASTSTLFVTTTTREIEESTFTEKQVTDDEEIINEVGEEPIALKVILGVVFILLATGSFSMYLKYKK